MKNAKQRRAEKRRIADAMASRDGLQNVVAGLGTSRDKASFTEYGITIVLDRNALENMYRDSWLAKKIVNAPAEDMTRSWRTFMGEDDQEETSFALEEAERRLGVRAKVAQAIKWSRLYGGAVLLMGVGNPDGYSKPLDPARVKKGDLRFVLALDRWMCNATGEFDWDIESPNFGLPKFYTIANQKSLRVHHSRIIRFIGQELPHWSAMQNQKWGDSELQHTYATLKGRDTMTAAIATMMFEANVDVIRAPDLADVLSTQEGEAKLTKRFQVAGMMKSFNRMLLLDSSEEYDKKSNTFSGLDALIREFRAEVAGASDIPVSRLFGTSASGLNATGDNDVRNYYDMIAGRQEAMLRPALEKFDEVFIRSELGAIPDDYRFEFPSLWQMSDKEKADIEKTRSDRDKAYFDMGVLTEGAIARELKESGTYATLTDLDVSLAEELGKPMGGDPDGIGEEDVENDEQEVGSKPDQEQP